MIGDTLSQVDQTRVMTENTLVFCSMFNLSNRHFDTLMNPCKIIEKYSFLLAVCVHEQEIIGYVLDTNENDEYCMSCRTVY